MVSPDPQVWCPPILDKYGVPRSPRLVGSHLPLVVSIGQQYRGRGVELDDLVAEGTLALVRAVDRFDPAEGARLNTYATRWIRESMVSLLGSSTLIRVPHQQRELGQRWRAAQTALTEANGRAPSGAEVAQAMGLGEKRHRNIAKALRAGRLKLISLGDQSELDCDFAGEEGPGSAQDARDQVRDLLRSRVHLLSPREQVVIAKRYGLDGRGGKSYHAIARELGLCRDTVRRLDQSARLKLRTGKDISAKRLHAAAHSSWRRDREPMEVIYP
jgi:RNA polymerase sigma factor (sigma-70 family)